MKNISLILCYGLVLVSVLFLVRNKNRPETEHFYYDDESTDDNKKRGIMITPDPTKLYVIKSGDYYLSINITKDNNNHYLEWQKDPIEGGGHTAGT
jgi:hypothetical protein